MLVGFSSFVLANPRNQMTVPPNGIRRSLLRNNPEHIRHIVQDIYGLPEVRILKFGNDIGRSHGDRSESGLNGSAAVAVIHPIHIVRCRKWVTVCRAAKPQQEFGGEQIDSDIDSSAVQRAYSVAQAIEKRVIELQEVELQSPVSSQARPRSYPGMRTYGEIRKIGGRHWEVAEFRQFGAPEQCKVVTVCFEEADERTKIQRPYLPSSAPILQCVPGLGAAKYYRSTIGGSEVVRVAGSFEWGTNWRICSQAYMATQDPGQEKRDYQRAFSAHRAHCSIIRQRSSIQNCHALNSLKSRTRFGTMPLNEIRCFHSAIPLSLLSSSTAHLFDCSHALQPGRGPKLHHSPPAFGPAGRL